MAKRMGPGPFAAAPIVQGNWDGTGTPDVLSFLRGTVMLPAGRAWYDNIDPYQGSIVFWITPEWDGNDGLEHRFLSNQQFFIRKLGNDLAIAISGTSISVDISGWTAGTTYCVIARWDSKNTIDGTNYGCISINDAHTFGDATVGSAADPGTSLFIGLNEASTVPANAIIEGLTIYRRPLWDGTYGIDVGNGDEIAAIYAAGAGADPCLITGSWDAVFCLPTDAAPGALTTGVGEAWSQPHSSEIEEHAFLEDGGYLAEPYAVLFNGTTTSGNSGSGATLDDLADAMFTAAGWFRLDGYGEGITLCYVFTKENAGQNQGWHLRLASSDLEAGVRCATTHAYSLSSGNELPTDGKWHYITMFFNDAGDRKIYLAIDGRWQTYSLQTAGVGAIVPDAANDLYIGARVDGNFTFDGCIGWSAIWSDDHHSHGTDFIPPRTAPTPGGNLVETWHNDEGTGANAAAHVTTPANDCALTNHTWEEQWEAEGTPPEMTSLEFDGAATSVNCGSGATIDDLADAAMTAEAWVRADGAGGSNVGRIFDKTGAVSEGWRLRVNSAGNILATVYCATTNAAINYAAGILDRKWCHLAITWDDAGDRKLRLYQDGILVSTSDAGVGAIVADATRDLGIGNRPANAIVAWDGAFGWSRISDVVRYTDTFVPPGRSNPPAVDGNTVAQYDGDGAGTTLTDSSGNANNGTITFGSGRWWNTPCMEWAAQGERVFQWGYALGSDGANDGFHQTLSGLAAGSNYVKRIPLRYGRSRRAWPRIQLYDETNGAAISSFDGPRLSDIHTGGNNLATLINANGHFPQALVDGTVYNITDGSSATITAVSGDMTTITGGLAGGTDNDWDTNDVYMIVPPNEDSWVWCEPFCAELPTIARNGAAADCVSASLKLVNLAGEGVILWQQAEWLTNLIDNPSLETGAGNPWIPDGWTNIGLDAGDSEQELTIVHSGNASLQYNVGAANEEVHIGLTTVVGTYVALGCWLYYSASNNRCFVGYSSADHARHQARANTQFRFQPTVAAVWESVQGVGRIVGAAQTIYIHGQDAGPAQRYFDDVYLLALDAVSLTATPASEANSAESGGIRVDGLDTMTTPLPPPWARNSRLRGAIEVGVVPRHSIANAQAFGQAAEFILDEYEDANNYVRTDRTTNTVTDRYNAQGAGEQTSAWAAAGLWAADTKAVVKAKWGRGYASLLVDGVERAMIAGDVSFAADFSAVLDWLTRQDGLRQADAVAVIP